MEIGSMESVRAKENNTICLPTTFKVYFHIKIGKFLNGLKNQYGIYTRRLNNKIYIYQGEFKLGKFHGNGKITIDNRQYFSGIFMNGKAEGKGQINLKLGIFKGLFESNLINGEG